MQDSLDSENATLMNDLLDYLALYVEHHRHSVGYNMINDG
jgi:hypothetical protein